MVTREEGDTKDISSKVNFLLLSSGGKRKFHPGSSREREGWTDSFEDGDLKLEAEKTIYRDSGGRADAAGSSTKVTYKGRVVFREDGSRVQQYHPGEWEGELEGIYGAYRSERISKGASRAFAIFVGLFGGLFLLSSNMTGNAISETSQNYPTILGFALLLVGLIGVFAFFKKSI